MAVDVETLLVRMEARITEFEKAMDRAQAKATATTTKINATFANLNKKLVSGFKTLAGGFIGITALTQVPKFISDVVEQASRLVDTSEKLKISTDDLQKLAFAAEQTGSSFEQMSEGLAFFQRQIGEAGRGQGELFKILQANGVALRDQAGNMRPLLDLFMDYSDLVKNAADQEARALLVTKGLGRANDELVNSVAQGKKGWKDYGDELERIGGVQDRELLAKAEKIGDEFDKLLKRVSTSVKGFVLQRVTTFDEFVDALNSLDPTSVDDWIRLLRAFDRATATGFNFKAPELPEPSPDLPVELSAVLQLEKQIAENRLKQSALLARIAELQKTAAGTEELEALKTELGLINLELTNWEAAVKRIIALGPPLEPGAITTGPMPPPPLEPGAITTGPMPPPTKIPGAENEANKIDATIKALNEEAIALGLTGRELARYEALTRAGIDANHEMAPAVLQAADAAYDAEQAQKVLNAEMEKGIERADELRDALAESMRTLIDGLIEGKSAAEALGNVLNQIANRLLDKGIQLLIDALLGPTGSSAGGIIGSALFGGGRQHGGPVQSGRGYLVGERGPELFVPNVSGRIVPGSAGAEGRYMVELVLTEEIDARIRRVSGPQSERIAFAVTRANNAAAKRQQELRG